MPLPERCSLLACCLNHQSQAAYQQEQQMVFQAAAAAAVPRPPVRSYRLSTVVAAAPLTPLQELHLKPVVLRRW